MLLVAGAVLFVLLLGAGLTFWLDSVRAGVALLTSCEFVLAGAELLVSEELLLAG